MVEPLHKRARILKSLVVDQCQYLSPTHPLTHGLSLSLAAIPMSTGATSRESAADVLGKLDTLVNLLI
jgi:hypothetical protein